MCGVVGFWHKDGKEADKRVLEDMVQRLAHRGPDDQGVWTSHAIGLGHTRLSILDLSEHGHQPFVTDDNSSVVSFNGEIYNYLDLRQQLENEGVSFKSTCDTEVLLYALRLWGPQKAVPKLDGMFAFAYFDLERQTLWLARDRSGIKPLYWIDKGNFTVFASEMKALFDHPDVVCRPDMHTLTTHILFARLVGEWTPFEDVKSLLPGTMIRMTPDKTETITYFDLLRDVNVDRILKSKEQGFDDLLRSFEEHFQDSVKSHLVSDAPLAVMCSGGLDSSLMTAVAKELKPDLVAYVADIDGCKVPEAEKSQTVCDHVGVELRTVKVDQDAFFRLWPKAAYYNDQPSYFAQNIPVMAVCQVARDDGFKVLLTGEGSDELYGGYPWQVDAYHMWRLRRWHSMVVPNNQFFRNLGHYISRFAPFDLPELMKQPFTHLDEMSSMHQSSPARLSSIDGLQRRIRAQNLFSKLEKITPLEERAFLARSYEDFYSHLQTVLRSNDKMTMAASIEARVPFLSNRSIDFGLHLNCRAKYRRKMTKYIVKMAGEKKIPHHIVHAPKVGFEFSNRMWANGTRFLRDGMVGDLFKWGKNEAEEIYKDLESERNYLFILISVDLWARIYFNNESPQSLSDQLLTKLR